MNTTNRSHTPKPQTPRLVLKRAEVPEHTVVCHELERSDADPFALDPRALERFVSGAMKRFGRDGLALDVHGFYLQIDPLVLLFEGRLEGVKRAACVPIRDEAAARGGANLLTFPPAHVLELEVPDAVPLSVAVPRALDEVRARAIADEDTRLGSFVRLHVIPDRRAPSGARTVLRIELLGPRED